MVHTSLGSITARDTGLQAFGAKDGMIEGFLALYPLRS